MAFAAIDVELTRNAWRNRFRRAFEGVTRQRFGNPRRLTFPRRGAAGRPAARIGAASPEP